MHSIYNHDAAADPETASLQEKKAFAECPDRPLDENTGFVSPFGTYFDHLVKKHRMTVNTNDESCQYVIREIGLPAAKKGYGIAKRAFDLLFSIIAGTLLLIPMLLIAVAVKIDSPGPVFYRQERLGKNRKPFTLWKFRSMRVDAEASGAQWAVNHDDRCTRIGRLLRLCRADELPQIYFNIIPGNLSIVGPRPERAFFYEEFSRYITGFEQRMLVTPGLTGLAQINGGYDLKPEEKIVYDIEYIESRSILTDFAIMLKTVKVVLGHNGAK